ncbi:hypothetical protein [Conexibacter sp. CPCC 206217]|uniref:hypothetical protein n=1 Tax=Conexibacter sp. CPCC 206217 TaxID=3064574 RepID=UPI00272062B1|nr:hypothetical protein [Conexibacter sp. CPCC 206217]MDO8210588.1 hypothetical protein [Conexibacter sp. CPCC 206217]
MSTSRKRLLAGLLGAATIAAGGAAIATATTGVGTGLPEPAIKVPPEIGNQFVGQFVLSQIDRRARITAGQVMIDYTETVRPYIVGNLTLYGYDNAGRQSSSTSNLYPFRFHGRLLRANILTQGSNGRIGSVTFQLPTSPTEMSGTLTWRGGTYDVVYTRGDDDADPTAPLPNAKQIDPVPPKLTKEGIGPRADAYYGRYALEPSEEDPGTSAGVYAPIVRVAEALSTGQLVADSGSLTLFGDQPIRSLPPTPAAIVTFHGPSATRVAYLTDFRWGGDWRTATVRGGSTEGPAVGRFAGRLRGNRLTGTLTTGRQRVELTFVRKQR